MEITIKKTRHKHHSPKNTLLNRAFNNKDMFLLRKELFRKYVLPHIKNWLSKIISKDIVRFESVDGVIARFNNKWKTDYGRVCATKNKALFYGDVMLVYDDKDFVPNKYIVGYSPSMFYELEWYRKELDPLKGVKEVIVFKETPKKEELFKILDKHGIKYKIYEPSKKEAYELAKNHVLGWFFDKLGGIYSNYTYYHNRLGLPEINYYICNYINKQFIKQEYPPTKIKKKLPTPEHLLKEIAYNEIKQAIESFKSIYRFLTGKEPDKTTIHKLKKELMKITRDFEKYHSHG